MIHYIQLENSTRARPHTGTDKEIRFDLESEEDKEEVEDDEEKKVKKEEITLPETYMILASLADAGSCASVRFICGSKNVLGEKHVDTFDIVRNGTSLYLPKQSKYVSLSNRSNRITRYDTTQG